MRRPRNFLKSIVEKLLIEEPRSRERRNRMRSIAYLVKNSYPELEGIDKDRLINAIDMAVNCDRYFRMIPNEEGKGYLKGEDWNDGKVLAQEWQLEEGNYESGYNSINEEIKKIIS